MPDAHSSEEVNVSEIELITNNIRTLGQSVDFWNQLMLWGLAWAAFAVVFAMVATRIVVTRTGQLSTAQGLLSAAKDRKLQENFKIKRYRNRKLKARGRLRYKDRSVRRKLTQPKLRKRQQRPIKRRKTNVLPGSS